MKVVGQGDQWERIAEQLDAFGEANGWPPDLAFSIRLIAEELVVNAVSYGKEKHDTEVRLDLLSEPEAVKMELQDNGKPYNPLEEAPIPDFEGDVEDRPIGGLGVHLVKELSDELTYRHSNGLNRLTVIKRRAS